MAYYKSLREYLEELDKVGNLVTITTPINKDTQLNPLVSLQYRGLPAEQRRAFLFTNVFDSRGKKYDIPVAIALDAPKRPNALGLQCPAEEITERLIKAFMHPIEPRLVENGPVQSVVYMGDRLLEKGGLDEFPVPIVSPGLDAAPTCTGSCWVTKDIESGIRNVGIYRSQLFSPTRMGIHMQGPKQGIAIHWQKCRARGIPLQVAIVIGGPPNLSYASASNFLVDVDEYSIAGAITGEPVELVKCKTVDLEVPANADIVIEGEMTTKELEMEAPFGETHGYQGMEEMQPYVTVKCITHRKDPIWPGHVRQLPIGKGSIPQPLLYKYLKYDNDMSNVMAVGMICGFTVIKMKMHTDQKEVWRILRAVNAFSSGRRVKNIVAVDEDIDIRNIDMVLWALDTRVEPHRDCRVIRYVVNDLKHAAVLPEDEMIKVRHAQFETNLQLPKASRQLINATLKWAYPPVCLPKKEFMEDALRIWQELGKLLPPLKLQEPWYSYELGYWPDDSQETADRAVRGEYYKTSEERAKHRKKV